MVSKGADVDEMRRDSLMLAASFLSFFSSGYFAGCCLLGICKGQPDFEAKPSGGYERQRYCCAELVASA